MNEELLLATFIIVTTLLVCWRIIDRIRTRSLIRRVKRLHTAVDAYHKAGRTEEAKDCLDHATFLLNEIK